MRTDKSSTDRHWDERALEIDDEQQVNIGDIYQPQLELDLVYPHLEPGLRMLEVGCGNGHTTKLLRERVAHVDAFDFSANMIERAKKVHGEANNRFFTDDVLAPSAWEAPYDLILCIRVLINLRDLDEQKRATRNMLDALKPGGKLVLLEGFVEGFERLSQQRARLGMPPLQPAAINFYSRLSELMPDLEAGGKIVERGHLGGYDFLTRVAYPHLVGADQVEVNSEYSRKFFELARCAELEELGDCSRVQAIVVQKD